MIASQEWTHSLPVMQQSVLFAAVRGPDGISKYHPSKFLIRWYRRCILIGALDHNVFTNPHDPRGGSFTGPSFETTKENKNCIALDHFDWRPFMEPIVWEYLRSLDELPHHFQLHFLHAAQIIGYKHPDDLIRTWWYGLYLMLVDDMHLLPETKEAMDYRLSDNEWQWREKSHKATQE